MNVLSIHVRSCGGGWQEERGSLTNDSVAWTSDEHFVWDIFNTKAQEYGFTFSCSPLFSDQPPRPQLSWKRNCKILLRASSNLHGGFISFPNQVKQNFTLYEDSYPSIHQTS